MARAQLNKLPVFFQRCCKKGDFDLQTVNWSSQIWRRHLPHVCQCVIPDFPCLWCKASDSDARMLSRSTVFPQTSLCLGGWRSLQHQVTGGFLISKTEFNGIANRFSDQKTFIFSRTAPSPSLLSLLLLEKIWCWYHEKNDCDDNRHCNS